MIIIVYGNDPVAMKAEAAALRKDGHKAFTRAVNQFTPRDVEKCDKVILLSPSAAIREAYGDKVETPAGAAEDESGKPMTKDDIVAALTEKGVEFDPKAKKGDLLALLEQSDGGDDPDSEPRDPA